MIYLAYMHAELTEARSRIDPTDWVPLLSARPELLRRYGRPMHRPINSLLESRRRFFGRTGGFLGLGAAALVSLGLVGWELINDEEPKNHLEILEQLLKEGKWKEASLQAVLNYLPEDKNPEFWNMIKNSTDKESDFKNDPEYTYQSDGQGEARKLETGHRLIKATVYEPNSERKLMLIRVVLKYNPFNNQVEKENLSFSLDQQGKVNGKRISGVTTRLDSGFVIDSLSGVLSNCPTNWFGSGDDFSVLKSVQIDKFKIRAQDRPWKTTYEYTFNNLVTIDGVNLNTQ